MRILIASTLLSLTRLAAADPAACLPAKSVIESGKLTKTMQPQLCTETACVSLDLHTKAWSVSSPISTVTMMNLDEGKMGKHKLSVCPPSGKNCKDLDPPNFERDKWLDTMGNDDMSVVAIFGEPGVELHETATWKLIAAIPAWKTPANKPATVSTVHFVDHALEVIATYTPDTNVARLYDVKTGALLGPIGSATTEIDDHDPIPLTGTQIAVLEYFGRGVDIVDSATGKLVKSIALTKTGSRPVGFDLANGAQLVVAPSDPSMPLFAVDGHTGAVAKYPIPICKK